jgi:hypothetical protein
MLTIRLPFIYDKDIDVKLSKYYPFCPLCKPIVWESSSAGRIPCYNGVRTVSIGIPSVYPPVVEQAVRDTIVRYSTWFNLFPEIPIQWNTISTLRSTGITPPERITIARTPNTYT